MGIGVVMNTGQTGMMAAKSQIATSSHNISNADTEGFNRQRVNLANNRPRHSGGGYGLVGTGVNVDRMERLNDAYVEKQIRTANRELVHTEEKDMVLQQVEDVFNELDGEGLNRLMSRFFNEFRNLSNDPDSEAVRQAVRESSQALVNDFHRLRNNVEEVRRHIDARVTNYVTEVNALGEELKDLNLKIKTNTISNDEPLDLMDRRDLVLKKLSSLLDVSMHQDEQGNYVVDVTNVGPLVAGPQVLKFMTERAPADGEGKPENAVDIRFEGAVSSNVTHRIQGGRIGALLEARDRNLSLVLDRLDDLAYGLTKSVNEVHSQGLTRHGTTNVNYFRSLSNRARASEYIGLSEEIAGSVNNIATGVVSAAPGDNRVALAIAGLQDTRVMNDGQATMDDWFNSMVGDVGVARAKNRSSLNQQKNIVNQLDKIRDQISGVSIDEETANILKFQHVFDASARVIQVADEMLETVLNLGRR